MPNPLELLFTVVAGVGQLVGIRAGTEQPVYAVVEQHGAVEIRRYEPRIVAETTVEGDVMDARNEGFRRIAGYIFGGNTTKASIAMTAPVVQAAAPIKGASQTIAMTAPVVQARDAGGWRVQFVMPARYTMANLPAPNDARVRIVQAPAQDYAVLRCCGSQARGRARRWTNARPS